MRPLFPALVLLSGLALVAPPHGSAAEKAGPYVQPVATLDAAGGLAAAGHYSQTASLGDIGGVSSGAAPGAAIVARNGVAGQLYEVTRLKMEATPTTVDEGGTSRTEITATLDDLTRLRLSAGEVRWHVFLGPVESIDNNGVITFGNVYQDSVASIQVGYQNHFDGLRFTVRNVGLDDFGIYAHDGIPDLWQVQHFGADNPLGAGQADPDGDGQDNLFEYLAGLSPTNAASRFTLEIADLPELPGQKAVIFSPRLGDRSYTVEASTNLGGAFHPLTGAQQVDFGATRFVLDPNAAEPTRFYRVRISLP